MAESSELALPPGTFARWQRRDPARQVAPTQGPAALLQAARSNAGDDPAVQEEDD